TTPRQYWPVNSHLFYVLNQRTDLRPDDLVIVNPAAPPNVTDNQARRWSLTTGRPLKQNMPAYWEVPLTNENFNRLAQMDVIYMPIRAPQGTSVLFTEEQRRLLTRLVDGGVLLWIDWASDDATTKFG